MSIPFSKGCVVRTLRITAVLCFLLACMSCTTRSMLRFEKFRSVTEKGDFLSTVIDLKKQPKLYGKNGRFLYNMDIGMLYHFAGMYDSSTAYLLKASKIYDDLFTRSVTNEAASILINDNVRPYRSKPYEITLLHQVLQFNYLSMNLTDEALVEARATQLLFNEWERKNAKDNRYFTDGMFHYVTSMAYDQEGQTDDAMISLFKAVQAYQQGPVALPPAVSDQAFSLFQKNNRAADIDRLKIRPVSVKPGSLFAIENEQTEIVVVGYAGKGPVLVENEWWGDWVKGGVLILHHKASDGRDETMVIPAPIPVDGDSRHNGKSKEAATVFVKVAVPDLKTYSSQTSYFTVEEEPGIRSLPTYIVGNLNQQAGKQLEDAKGSIVARTVARVVTRTIAAQEAKKQMATDSPIANLLISLGTDLLSSQLEKADTRCCFFIPQTVQIARIPVKPGIHTVTVSARDNGGAILSSRTFADIEVKPHKKKFVFYCSFR
jgi:uncharacterized protein